MTSRERLVGAKETRATQICSHVENSGVQRKDWQSHYVDIWTYYDLLKNLRLAES